MNNFWANSIICDDNFFFFSRPSLDLQSPIEPRNEMAGNVGVKFKSNSNQISPCVPLGESLESQSELPPDNILEDESIFPNRTSMEGMRTRSPARNVTKNSLGTNEEAENHNMMEDGQESVSSNNDSSQAPKSDKNESSTDCTNDTDEPRVQIVVGQKFNTFEQVSNTFKSYCVQNLTHYKTFHKRNFNQKINPALFAEHKVEAITFGCRHYGKLPKSREKATQARPNQSYIGLNCPFHMLASYDKKENCYIVRRFVTHHENHPVNKETYEYDGPSRRLTQEEQKKFGTMMCETTNISMVDMKTIIAKETGKKLSTQDLINLKNKFLPNSNLQDIQRTILLLKEEHAKDEDNFLKIVTAEGDPDKFQDPKANYIKSIFWMSSEMKKLFEKYGSLCMMDGTYSLDITGYVLFTFMITDRHAKARLGAWALVSNEEQISLREVLTAFTEAINNKNIITNFIVDKDRNEISLISQFFPAAEITICRYHSKKAVGRHIHDIKGLPQNLMYIKDSVKDSFDTMLCSVSDFGHSRT